MTNTFAVVTLLVVLSLTAVTAKRPCNWRCNAPECTCIRREPVELSECICAGEKGLGQECLDELQCNGGNKCVEGVCTKVQQGPPQVHRWAYQDIFDKQE
ncbi:hypothetical protein AAVH_20936 [Aphelenchoides avenae]|nr:hypothetical protein AAVH_20936 [Aphelenchus avenae]